MVQKAPTRWLLKVLLTDLMTHISNRLTLRMLVCLFAHFLAVTYQCKIEVQTTMRVGTFEEDDVSWHSFHVSDVIKLYWLYRKATVGGICGFCAVKAFPRMQIVRCWRYTNVFSYQASHSAVVVATMRVSGSQARKAGSVAWMQTLIIDKPFFGGRSFLENN